MRNDLMRYVPIVHPERPKKRRNKFLTEAEVEKRLMDELGVTLHEARDLIASCQARAHAPIYDPRNADGLEDGELPYEF